MYDHIFYEQVQISRSDIRLHIKWAVSLVILHMVTSIFLQGLCGYIWANILTLSPRRGFSIDYLFKYLNLHTFYYFYLGLTFKEVIEKHKESYHTSMNNATSYL